jgi:hypothetical protein
MSEEGKQFFGEGHWYSPLTKQQIDPEGKRLDARHAKKNGWLGGITSVTKVLANPQLVRWQQETAVKALLAILEADKGLTFTDEEKSLYVRRSAEEGPSLVASTTADEGKAIHAAVDRFYRGELVDPKYMPWVVTVEARIRELGLDPHRLKAEVDAIDPLLEYGCRGDLVSYAPPVYIDIKTRDFTQEDVEEAVIRRGKNQKSLGKLTPYQTEPMQVIGNMDAHFGLMHEDALGYCLYLSRTDPTISYLHLFTREELNVARRMLRACTILFNVPRGLGGGDDE